MISTTLYKENVWMNLPYGGIESINIERLSNTITLMFESQNLKHQHKLTPEKKEYGDYIIIKLYVEEHV